MRSRLITVVSILAALATAPALADAELLLTDGKVLRGVDVKLEGGYYLLEMQEGEVVAIPASLVRELHLLDTRKTREGVTIGLGRDISRPASGQPPPSRLVETRPNWRRGAPQDLVGQPIRFNEPAQQTRVFGEPAGFQKSLVPFRFEPTHAWDRDHDVLGSNRSRWPRTRFDPVWRPRTAFDMNADVLESSRTRWSTGSRAMDWNPSNSFSRLRADRWWGRDGVDPAGVRLDWRGLTRDCGWCAGVTPDLDTFTEPEQELTAEACALRLLSRTTAPETIQSEAIGELPVDLSPARLFRAWDAENIRAVFSIAGDSCRLIGGDLETLLGVDLSETDALDYAVDAWNGIVIDSPITVGATPAEQLDLVVTLARLFETATAGSAAAQLELLEDRSAVERVLSTETPCSSSAAFRRSQRAHVDRNFEKARADLDLDTARVVLWAHLDRLGEVLLYDVTITDGGQLSMSREVVAEHLGEHTDR